MRADSVLLETDPASVDADQERAGRRRVVKAMAMFTFANWPLAARAETYPTRPIRLLVGFAPGGGSDMIARLLVLPLQTKLGQSVVVENRAGAGGNIAADLTAKSAPDGYTLLLVPSGHASNAAIKKTLPFRPVIDFTWISTVTTYPLVLSVLRDSPIGSFAQLLQVSRNQPGKLTYSTVGVGTAMHLVAEWILAEAGGGATHVPYKGGTGPLTDLLGGRVDVMIDTMTSTIPLLHDGRLRALAVTSPAGKSPLPGVPAVADSLPNVVFESWLGIAGPAGLPAPVVERLNREIGGALGEPGTRKQLLDWGGTPAPSTPAEFQARVERDIARLRKLVAERHIEVLD